MFPFIVIFLFFTYIPLDVVTSFNNFIVSPSSALVYASSNFSYFVTVSPCVSDASAFLYSTVISAFVLYFLFPSVLSLLYRKYEFASFSLKNFAILSPVILTDSVLSPVFVPASSINSVIVVVPTVMAAISSVVDLLLKATLAAVFETSNISAILVLSAGFSV